MKNFVFILVNIFYCLTSVGQMTDVKGVDFKPRYAGTSVNTGFMYMPQFGSAFYVAPKLVFQTTPRFFVTAGLGVMQYNMLPSKQMTRDGSFQRTATQTYIFAEGIYLLSERLSVNGSVMKDVSPAPMRRTMPYRIPTEAMHFGVDYKLTPNITVGARIGYSNSGRSGNFEF